MPVTIQEGRTNFFDIGLDVFGHKVCVMFCDDIKHELLNLHPEVGRLIDAEALIYKYNHEAQVELFLRFDAKAGSIAHEAFHAVWNLYEYHGMKRDDEGMAYHLGYLVEAILEAQIEALEAKNAYVRNKVRNKELENAGVFYCLL